MTTNDGDRVNEISVGDWTVMESGLGHRTLSYKGITHMYNHQMTVFEMVVIKELTQIHMLLKELKNAKGDS